MLPWERHKQTVESELSCCSQKHTATEELDKMSAAIREQRAEEGSLREGEKEDFDFSVSSRRKPAPPRQQTISPVPEAVDDLVRNFLCRAGLRQTLSSFQVEWYDSAQKILTESLNLGSFVPDALTHRRLLLDELETVCRETEELGTEVRAKRQSLLTTQRETDFHRLQHQRVSEDKERLKQELGQLRTHLQSLEPARRQLEDKHQAALSQKMLLSLQRDRIQDTVGTRTTREKHRTRNKSSINDADGGAVKTTAGHQNTSEFPVYGSSVGRPALDQESPYEKRPMSFSLQASIRGHHLPISSVQLHPQERLLASASDDHTWRLWVLPTPAHRVGERKITGKGHSDWLTACSFHPDGSKLATTSGDATVRLWDLSNGLCTLTLAGHSQPTWGCSFHSTGLFLASCSADKTVKVWDLTGRRCRVTLRRHTDCVNSVCFLTSSNLLLSCSADQSIALWDARLGICTATFSGHQYPCNHVALSPVADILASCDGAGVVKLWDLRKPQQALVSVDTGPSCSNQVSFGRTGKVLAVASGDGLLRLIEVELYSVRSLAGHQDSVQSVTFDHREDSVVSAGSDGMIIVWG